MEEALECVGLDNWIRTLPLGLDYWIAPGGAHLSGGQRQRLSIARALLMDPRILILDEAASCLDAVSEQSLLLKLRSLLPGATVIVVSHRLSTVSCMERVLVFENGRIVEDGKPSVLLANENTCFYLFP
jgi:ABC-type multidrug transport system fused ATPase/permease subunit